MAACIRCDRQDANAVAIDGGDPNELFVGQCGNALHAFGMGRRTKELFQGDNIRRIKCASCA